MVTQTIYDLEKASKQGRKEDRMMLQHKHREVENPSCRPMSEWAEDPGDRQDKQESREVLKPLEDASRGVLWTFGHVFLCFDQRWSLEVI